MQFLLDHVFWVVAALVSGTLLALPLVGRRHGGQALDTLGATRLINQGALVLDVRTPAEFAAGHVAHSRNIPMPDLAQRCAELPGKPAVIVLCEAGRTAGQAAAVLRQAGRAEVYCLEGGLHAWRQAGLPLFKGEVS